MADGTVTVEGGGADALREPASVLDCANSGTSLRMLAGLVAGRPFLTVLTGDAAAGSTWADGTCRRTAARHGSPRRRLRRADGALAPLVVRGGRLVGVHHRLTVASGQVKTALVLAGLQACGHERHRRARAQAGTHTERMLAALGAPVRRADPSWRGVRSRRAGRRSS